MSCSGFHFETDTRHLISQTISDHPEGNSLAMIDMLQCRYCLGQPEKYADIDLEWSHRSCNSRNVAQMREKYRMSRHTDWAIPYVSDRELLLSMLLQFMLMFKLVRTSCGIVEPCTSTYLRQDIAYSTILMRTLSLCCL